MLSVENLESRLLEIEHFLQVCYEDNNQEKAQDLTKELQKIEKALSILKELDLEQIDRIVYDSILWDAPRSANLPQTVEVKISLDNIDLLEDFYFGADNLSDYLSDTYEFCHKGFHAEILPGLQHPVLAR